MTQTEMFKRLGAPLANARWSWGGVRASDGAIFLRVWQDEGIRHESKLFMRVLRAHRSEDRSDVLGYQERLVHVASVRSGSPCFMIMCVAKDPSVAPRAIQTFNDQDVFVGGAVIERGDSTYVELADRWTFARARAQENA